METRNRRFMVGFTPTEKQVLEQLAEIEGGISQAAVVRRLVRREAQKRGLWTDLMARGVTVESERIVAADGTTFELTLISPSEQAHRLTDGVRNELEEVDSSV